MTALALAAMISSATISTDAYIGGAKPKKHTIYPCALNKWKVKPCYFIAKHEGGIIYVLWPRGLK